MRIIKCKAKNPEFLGKYGKLLQISILLSIFCQIISTTTEVGVFYANLTNKFSFLGWFSFLPTTILTIGFVAGIELGGRAILSYAVDALLYFRFKGLELFLSLVVIPSAFFLLKTSLNVSVEGSPQVVESFSKFPTLASTETVNTELTNEKAEIYRVYGEDKALIESNYNQQIATITSQYKGKTTKLQKSIDNYTRKEQRGQGSFKSRKNYLYGKIAELESERDLKIGVLEGKKGAELKSLMSQRELKIAKAKGIYEKSKSKIDRKNDKATNKHENQKEANKGSLSNLVYATFILFILSVVVERIIYKGAEIEIYYEFTGGWLDAFLTPQENQSQTTSKTAVNNQRKRTIKGTRKSDDTSRATIEKKGDDLNDDTTDKRKLYENRMATQSQKATIRNRNCSHCGDEYAYKHHKQKFCSDSCRKKAWEKKSGRKLKLKRKKQMA